mgnify:CR=1 FL=1
MKDDAKYKTEDISVVIPTYKRAADVKETLKHLVRVVDELCEDIIVDQSPDNETKNLVKELKNKKIKYIFSRIPSTAIARNMGIKSANKKSKIICFIDDDVTIGEDYFKEIIRVFNTHPNVKGCAIYDPASGYKDGRLYLLLKKIFFIGRREGERADLVSTYGNLYPQGLKDIKNAQWFPGLNTAYIKTIFDEQVFDENLLGYSTIEDMDFSYRIWKKYPKSLFITPFAGIIHRASPVERNPTKKMAYVNQVEKFYFQYKDINKRIFDLKFIWVLMGILLLRTSQFVYTRKKIDALKLKFFISSTLYCLINLDLIRAGKVREFLNDPRFNE